MSLQNEIKPCQINRLVEYFGGTRSDSMIHERSMKKSGEHDNRYISRQWICFEHCDCFISITAAGHRRSISIRSGRLGAAAIEEWSSRGPAVNLD